MVRLSPETQEWLECVAGRDLTPQDPLKVVPIDLVREDLKNKGARSDFYRLREQIMASGTGSISLVTDYCSSHGWTLPVQKSQMQEALVILDTAERFFICINEDSKMGYLQVIIRY